VRVGAPTSVMRRCLMRALEPDARAAARRYDCSGHMVWCGERTRQLDAAHLEFMRGIGNPIGVKISDKMGASDLVTMIGAFNPSNVPGRLAVVVRMGADKARRAATARAPHAALSRARGRLLSLACVESMIRAGVRPFACPFFFISWQPLSLFRLPPSGRGWPTPRGAASVLRAAHALSPA